ncbi:MAG: dicarboxylate/amino acid:cation symporter, partial [Planctomycetota bacterium]
MDMRRFLKQWRFTIILIGSVVLGAMAGTLLSEESAGKIKPLGDLFLNLLFTAVVPLIFFSLSSAVAGSSNLKRLGRIAGLMLVVFIVTGIVSACLMIAAVKVFNPAEGLPLELSVPPETQSESLAEKIVQTVSVPDFPGLLSRRNILALILFSVLMGLASQAAGEKGMMGLASQAAGEKGKVFREFLISGSAVMGHVIKLIMLYAPIGLAAYFAYFVAVNGKELLGAYARVVALY